MSGSLRRVPWGVLLALAAGLYACRSSEGERCVCADDCRADLVCVAEGRVLMGNECSPVTGPGANPGLCVSEDEAGLGDDGGGAPEVFMDLGSKRDFDPGPPPDPETDTETDTGSGTGTDTGSSSSDSGSGSSGSSDTGSTGSGSTDTGSTGSGSGSESSGTGTTTTGM